MRDIYEEILKALRQGGPLTVATIIARSGSTPVPPGARMLLHDDGGIPLGTVGGGCIEADVIREARVPWTHGAAYRIRSFTLTEDNIESGMLCGGHVDILIERLSPDQASLYVDLIARRDAGKDSAVLTMLTGAPAVLGKFLVPVEEGVPAADGLAAVRRVAPALGPSMEETLQRAMAEQTVTRVPFDWGEIIVEPVIGPQDLIIFGGGHVSRYVSRSAAMVGFRVTVIDERPEYANRERFPEAFRTLPVGFDASWSALESSAFGAGQCRLRPARYRSISDEILAVVRCIRIGNLHPGGRWRGGQPLERADTGVHGGCDFRGNGRAADWGCDRLGHESSAAF